MASIQVTTPRYTFQVEREPEPTYPVGSTVGSSRDAFDIAQHVIGADIAECLISIFLDSRRRVTGYADIVRGTFNAARFTPRDVLIPGLLAGCSAFVLAHNHPSQDPRPSRADRSMTAALRSACAIVGLHFVDHLIVTRDRYFSFRECEHWK